MSDITSGRQELVEKDESTSSSMSMISECRWYSQYRKKAIRDIVVYAYDNISNYYMFINDEYRIMMLLSLFPKELKEVRAELDKKLSTASRLEKEEIFFEYLKICVEKVRNIKFPKKLSMSLQEKKLQILCKSIGYTDEETQITLYINAEERLQRIVSAYFGVFDILKYTRLVDRGIHLYFNYKNEKELKEATCKKLVSTTNLTLKDFDYVSQKDYLISVLTNAIKNKEKGINILIYGKPGSGKTEFVKTLAKELHLTAIESNTNPKLFIPNSSNEFTNVENERLDSIKISQLLCRTNKNTFLVVDEAEDIFSRTFTEKINKIETIKLLEENDIPVIYIMNNEKLLDSAYMRRFSLVVEMNDIPKNNTTQLIENLSNMYSISLNDNIVKLITDNKISVAIIDKALKSYKLSGSNNQNDLYKSIYNTAKIMNYGTSPKETSTKINNDFLPELLNTDVNLKEISDNIINSGILNFSLLLYGCPGSSKTSFARYLAKKLDIDVLYTSYTDLVSCFVGETEHNIKNLFSEASQSKSMIIIDEADMLMRDRLKSTRSWETSTTEAFLTCIEDHKFPVVVTTNLFEDLDEAAMRRFDFKVKHDYLNKEQVKIAFNHFFGMNPKSNIEELKYLTPGDFATVNKRMRFLKNKSESTYIEELKKEMKVKKSVKTEKIGF